MAQAQVPGHLYGPAAPHIGFWYGERFLGEVRGHPADVGAARWKLQCHLEMLNPGHLGRGMQNMVAYGARAVPYCGPVSKPL